MIEEIKKDINKISELTLLGDFIKYEEEVVIVSELFKILDKYNSQLDYKKMWEELKSEYGDYYEMTALIDGKFKDIKLIEDMQELEQKHNIGVDIDE